MAKNGPDLSRFIETEPDKYVKVYKKGQPGHSEYGKAQPPVSPPPAKSPKVEIAIGTTVPSKIPHNILGACGEYYVAAFLSGVGLVVALAHGGAPVTDLLVTTPTGGGPVSIQVKTGGESAYFEKKRKPETSYWAWHAGKNAESIESPSHWYAFVHTKGWPQTDGPRIFFADSVFVAKRVRDNHNYDWFYLDRDEAECRSGLAGYQELRMSLGS